MPLYQLRRKQTINSSLDKVWDYISSPHNLKDITPSEMNFEIINKRMPKTMYEGMLISYKLNIFPWFKSLWVSEITHISENKYFIDVQRIGPYKLWHHQHIIYPIRGGVIMEDIVSYSLPLGLLGVLANSIFVSTKLNQIFDFRKSILEEKLSS